MNKVKNFIRKDGFFQTIVNVILFLFLIIELYPILYVISCSFSDPDMVTSGRILLLPKGFTLDGYKKILAYTDIWIGYANTIFYTVLGTVLNLAVTLPCAYALSRRGLQGKKIILIYFMITMYIGGGLVPSYLNIKSFGLVNNRLGILIMGALSVYNLMVARSFFANTIPYELTEAAKIDGADDFLIFGKIIMPLSKAITVVMIIYYGVGRWNSYFTEMIYLEDREKYPLQLFLREILLQAKFTQEAMTNGSYTADELEVLRELARSAELLKYCVIIVATLPMMLIYPKLQSYFEKGVMLGSVKG